MVDLDIDLGGWLVGWLGVNSLHYGDLSLFF